jgi:hypothetical protein
MLDSILDGVLRIMNDFLGVTQLLLCFASYLLVDAFGLLTLASSDLTGFLLDFASEVPNSAFDLIFVHGGFRSEVNDFLCERAS